MKKIIPWFWRLVGFGFTIGLIWAIIQTPMDHGIRWYSLLILIFPLAFRVWWDASKEKKNIRISHPIHWTVTVVMTAICALIVWRIEPVRFFIQPFLFSSGIFIFPFDAFINLAEGRAWYYIPEPDDEDQSKLDHVYYQLGLEAVYFIKAWILLLAFSQYFFLSLIL